MTNNRLRSFFGLIALLLQVVALPAVAQQNSNPQEPAQVGPCLDLQILDPSAASIPAATVTIGNREQQTGESGVASFCGLGPGPHRVIVSAEDFQVHEGSVAQSESRVTITLQLFLRTELVVVGSRARPRSVTESPVPIDAIRLADVVSQGSTTLD